MICDNDSIHHARAVTRYLEQHPRLELLYGARYSPHDNPVERIWGALKNYVANTAVTWPGRLKQIHAFFRNRSPGQMLNAAAPWTSPGCPRVTSRTSGMSLSEHRCLQNMDVPLRGPTPTRVLLTQLLSHGSPAQVMGHVRRDRTLFQAAAGGTRCGKRDWRRLLTRTAGQWRGGGPPPGAGGE